MTHMLRGNLAALTRGGVGRRDVNHNRDVKEQQSTHFGEGKTPACRGRIGHGADRRGQQPTTSDEGKQAGHLDRGTFVPPPHTVSWHTYLPICPPTSPPAYLPSCLCLDCVQIAEQLVNIYKECFEGNYSTVQRLQAQAVVGAAKSKRQVVSAQAGVSAVTPVPTLFFSPSVDERLCLMVGVCAGHGLQRTDGCVGVYKSGFE